MIERAQTQGVPTCKTIVSVTPDALMIAARQLHLAAQNAQPGQEILLDFTSGITLKYDPEITTHAVTMRTKARTPGTDVSSMVDRVIADVVAKEDMSQANNTVSH